MGAAGEERSRDAEGDDEEALVNEMEEVKEVQKAKEAKLKSEETRKSKRVKE